jgi:hypothetical protein
VLVIVQPRTVVAWQSGSFALVLALEILTAYWKAAGES